MPTIPAYDVLHQFFSYNCPFYRVKKIENFRVKRCLKDGVGSYGSYTTFLGLASGLFNDLIINGMEIRGMNSEDKWNSPRSHVDLW